MYRPANPAPTMTASTLLLCPELDVLGGSSRSDNVVVLLRRRPGRDR
jgi:hypothetical protein